jgi:hypothetical protein
LITPSLQAFAKSLKLQKYTLNGRAGRGDRGIPILLVDIQKTWQLGQKALKMKSAFALSTDFEAQNQGAMIRDPSSSTL